MAARGQGPSERSRSTKKGKAAPLSSSKPGPRRPPARSDARLDSKRTVGKKKGKRSSVLVAAKSRKIKRPTSSGKPMKVIRTVREMKSYLQQMRSRRRRIALVPTMGYLHEGHLSLVREAKRLASFVVVSVFVNPAQFGPNEDLDRYPRDLAGDRRKLRQEGVNVMFAPDSSEIYPEGFQTVVDVTDVTRNFCGASRPGHFRGVATVVFKLFCVVQPDLAVFGEKDYQQLVTIRQMVRDLSLDVSVVGVPTVREEDGLAMSSRNEYLSPTQRQQATAIYRGLRKAKRLLDSGERDAAELAAIVLDLLREERDLEVDYVAVCDPHTLERIPEVEKEAVLLVGVKVGETRLIDNIRLDLRQSRSRG